MDFFERLRAVSGVCRAKRMISPCRLGELEQVVGGADHRPFASHLIKASKEELSEASGMFDLAKDRLDDLLAQSVAAAPAGTFELSGHSLHARALAPSPFAGGIRLPVLGPARCQVSVDPAAGQMRQISLTAISGVGREFLGVGPQNFARSSQQRLEGTPVGRTGLEALGDDDLMGAIHRNLGIVALQNAGSRRLDAAVGIGEVALRAFGRTAVGAALGPTGPLHHARGPGPSSSGSGGGALASASSTALAARMRSSRAALLATQSGISSPRRSAP